jgi:hypothetical protein
MTVPVLVAYLAWAAVSAAGLARLWCLDREEEGDG